jgi:hypothetical protein
MSENASPAGSHGEVALQALRRLEQVTGEPPAADAEPDDVLVRATQVLAAREQALAELAAALECDPAALRGVGEATALAARIHERAAGWHAALARARHVVGERSQAVSRLRRLERR